MAAAHLDNFLFLLFVAVAILFQILTRAATKTRRRPGDTQRRSTSTPKPPIRTPRAPEQTDEDRIREFLEALGQPTTLKPPPPVAPRPTYQQPIAPPKREPSPTIRRILSPLPPLSTRPPDLPPETESPSHPPPPLESVTEANVRAAFQSATTQQIPAKVQGRIDLVTTLRTTSGLRNAIILREIFGPPRSLQPLDLVGV
jgi:hypothetical protein